MKPISSSELERYLNKHSELYREVRAELRLAIEDLLLEKTGCIDSDLREAFLEKVGFKFKVDK